MRIKAGLLSCFFTLLTLLSFATSQASAYEYTVGEVQSLIDGIVAFKLSESGTGSVQDWIDGPLTDHAGIDAEWYIVSLSQSGYTDFDSYVPALESYLASNEISSATSREKYAIALSAAGSGNHYITQALADSVGKQGIMSWIYGLHILNNGYSADGIDSGNIVEHLLSLQLPDGGWALFGEYGDIDVTAMTLQALAPHYPYNGDIQYAADRAVEFLSQKQKDDGGYASFGTENAESGAQVLTALSALGIDCQTDERFIRNGNTLIDGIAKYRLDNGSFCHTEGDGFNETATIQALYSLVAYRRMASGQGPLLVLDNRQPLDPEKTRPAETTPAAQQGGSGGAGNTGSGGSGNSPGRTVTTAKARGAVTVTRVSGTSAAFSTASAAANVSGAVKPDQSAAAESGETISAGTRTSTVKADSAEENSPQSSGGKLKAIIIILIAGALLSMIIFAIGKRNYKNFIAVGIVVAVAIAVVLLNDFRRPDDYYTGETFHKENAVGTVTMSISCETVLDKSPEDYIPSDGIILDVTEFEIEEGDTVFDILTEAAQTYGIQIDNKGSSGSAHGMVYIAGINYLYEMQYGDLSGWVYHVNGITPSRNCGEYVLSDGDCIEWLYTCELGYDLNEVYEE